MRHLKETTARFLCALFMLGSSTVLAAPLHSEPGEPSETTANPFPFAFEENRGQLDPGARFAARGLGMVALLEDGGADLRLLREDGSVWSLKLGFVGSQQIMPRGENPEAGVVNYTRGSDPSDWQLGVRRFRSIRYPELYQGIDARFYGREGAVEYDLIVAPGADPTAIKMSFEGSAALSIDSDGRLVVSSDADRFQFEPPFAYQDLRGDRHEVMAQYTLLENGNVGFELGAYDASAELTIDPVVLGYAAGFGGSKRDVVREMTRDASGFIYIVGQSESTTMFGAASVQANQGKGDAFVVKLTPDGSELVYATYYGGTEMDEADGVAVNAAGEAFVVGHTESAMIPTPNGFQTTPITVPDIFVARFDDAGVPVYGTYFGTDGEDGVNGAGIDLGPGDIAYVTGRIDGEMMVPMPRVNPFQDQDSCMNAICGYVAGFDTSLAGPASLIYSTYLKSNNDTAGHRVFVDNNGIIYLHGHTVGTTLLVDPAQAYQPTNAAARDHFILKLDPTRVQGAQRLYSTYFGGDDMESETGDLTADDAGTLWIMGATESTAAGFPLKNAGKSIKPANDADFYVAKFDTQKTGSDSLLWSTFLGGAGNESTDLIGLTVNTAEEVFVAGGSASSDFPVTNIVPGVPATGSRGYVVRMSADGQLLESTSINAAAHIALEPQGSIWVAGQVQGSALTPPTGKVLLPVSGGDADIFLARLDPVPNAVGIALSLRASQDTVRPGADYGYQVRVDNYGILDRDVSLTLSPGPGINLISWPGQTCTRIGFDLECAIGTVPAGESQSLTVLTRASGAGLVGVDATAVASPADADLTDNVASVNTRVDAAAGPISGVLTHADFDVVANVWDTGAFSIDTERGVFGTSNESEEDGVNLMTFDSSIPVYIVDGPDFDGEVAFGWVERNDWTPSDGDGTDLTGVPTQNPSDRVYATVAKGGVVRLYSAAAFEPGVLLGTNRVGLSPDRAFELERVGDTVFVRYDGMAVLAARPFTGFPAAAVGFSGDDGVITIGYGRDYRGSATISDVPPAVTTDGDADGVPDSIDNCPRAANGGAEAGIPGAGDQLDSDGNGVGDACECGDVSDDGFITVADPNFYRVHLANPIATPFSAVQQSKCNVIGGAQDCDLRDLAVLIRATQPVPLAPGIAPVCSAVTGTP